MRKLLSYDSNPQPYFAYPYPRTDLYPHLRDTTGARDEKERYRRYLSGYLGVAVRGTFKCECVLKVMGHFLTPLHDIGTGMIS